MTMNIPALLIGASLIICGFLVKKYPMLISGYNTMSDEEKKNVDIKGLSSFLKKGLICMGLIMAIFASLLSWLGLSSISYLFLIISLFLGMFILMAKSRNYDSNIENKFSKLLPAIIVGVIGIGVFISLIGGAQPTEVIVKEKSVKFTGQYGITIQKSNIEKVELLRYIPYIKWKSNGLGIGDVFKGHFVLDGLGKCRLYICSPRSPYILIKLNNGDKIIFNSSDTIYTHKIYKEIEIK